MNNLDTPEVQRAVKNIASPSDDQLVQQYLNEMGVTQDTVDQYDQQQAAKVEASRKERLQKALSTQADAMHMRDANLRALDTAAGVGTAVRDLARFTYNGIVDGVNAIEDYAASKGIGTGDLITAANKWDDPVNEQVKKTLGTEGQLARAVTNIAAPFMVGAATGGGAIAGITTDALYNYLAVDPNEKKLADHLKGTDFEDLPIISDLMTKPYDTETDSRIKNALTAGGISASVVGLFKAGAKVFESARGAKATQRALDNSEIGAALKSQEAATQTVTEAAAKATNRVLDNVDLSTVEAAQKSLVSENTIKAIETLPPKEVVGMRSKQGYNISTVIDPDGKLSVVAKDASGVEVASVEIGAETAADGSVKIVPAYIKNNTKDPNLTSEMLKYHKENLGDLSPSKYQTTQGKNFTDKMLNREAQATKSLEQPAQPDAAAIAKEQEQLNLFEQKLNDAGFYDVGVKTAEDGTPKIPNFDVENKYKLNETIAGMPDDTRAILYSPMTDAELKQIAKAHADDPEIVNKLLNFRQGDPLPDNVGVLVLKGLIHNQAAELSNLARAVDINKPESLLAFTEALNSYTHLKNVKEGTSSAMGAAFRSWKIGPIMEGADTKTWFQRIGNEGRSRLIKKTIEQAGGADNIASVANRIKAISEIPDGNFTSRMGEIVEKSKWMRFEDAVTKVAINGMLSSPMTSIKAASTNAVGMAKIILDDYALALTPGSQLTLAEANARVNGMMSALVDAHSVALDVAKKPIGVTALKLDLPPSQMADLESRMIDSGLTWVEKTADIAAAKNIPTKVLIGVDAYAQHIIKQGEIAQQVLRKAIKNNIPKEEMALFVEKELANLDPRIVDQADQLAAATTLAKEITPEFENAVEVVTNIAEKIPFNKVLMPFMRTNINAVEQVIENSPLGVFAPNMSRALKSADPLVKQKAIAKMATSTLALASLAYLGTTGRIQGISTKDERVLRGNDIPPDTSIQVGDKWVSVKDIPTLAPLINFSHFINKASGHLTADQMNEVITGFKLVVAETITPDTLAQATSGVFHLVLGDNEKGMKWLSTVPTRFVPLSGALKDTAQLNDKFVRQAMVDTNKPVADFVDTVFNRFKNLIPGLSKELPPIMNRYGEALMLPDGIGPDVITPLTTTDAKYLPHKRAIDNLKDYYRKYADVIDAPELKLYAAPKRIDAVVEVPGPMVNAKIPQGHEYTLTPAEYAVYQSYYGGINPMNGKVLEGGSLRDNEIAILKKYKLMQDVPAELDPKTYKAVVTDIHRLQLDFKKRADTLIKDYPSVKQNMSDQWDRINTFNQIQGIN